jgi:hypothetical protein
LLQKRPATDDLRHDRLDKRGWKSPRQHSADRVWESHRSRIEPEFRAWLPREPHPFSEKERRPPPGPNDRSCTPAVALSERRPFHWQDNCNGQIRHRPYTETSLHEAWSCPDRDLLGTLGTGAVEREASSAPTHPRLF